MPDWDGDSCLRLAIPRHLLVVVVAEAAPVGMDKVEVSRIADEMIELMQAVVVKADWVGGMSGSLVLCLVLRFEE